MGMDSTITNPGGQALKGIVLKGLAAAVIFALGVGAAPFLPYPPKTTQTAAAAPTTPAATPSAAAEAVPAAVLAAPSPPKAPTEAELLAQFRDIDWNLKEVQGMEVLAAGLTQSEALRAEVLKRFEQETQPTAKQNLKFLLTSQPDPKVTEVAIGWAKHENVAARINGFNLLVSQMPSAEIYQLTRQAIEQEKDPKALAAAIWALRFPGEVLDPEQVQTVVPKLHTLTQHPDADVRAASIQRLAQWDKGRKYVEQDVLRIVNSDTNSDTLMAAVGASSIVGLHSDELKRAFFKLIQNPNTNPELSGVTLWQMDRFLLTPSEYKTYMEATKQDK